MVELQGSRPNYLLRRIAAFQESRSHRPRGIPPNGRALCPPCQRCVNPLKDCTKATRDFSSWRHWVPRVMRLVQLSWPNWSSYVPAGQNRDVMMVRCTNHLVITESLVGRFFLPRRTVSCVNHIGHVPSVKSRRPDPGQNSWDRARPSCSIFYLSADAE